MYQVNRLYTLHNVISKYIFKDLCIYERKRERWSEWKRGGAEEENHQVDCTERGAQGIDPTTQETRTLAEIKTQMLNKLSCSGTPVNYIFYKKYKC